MAAGPGYFFTFDKMDYVRGKRPAGCILCAIRDGPGDDTDLTVHRDPLFVVTVNLYPYNPGHLLIFPARHLTDLRALTAEEAARLHRLQAHLLDALDRLYSPTGYNLGYNMGETAGASIPHLHLHVIPRFPNETGIADLLAGKRILVEDPRVTADRLRRELAHSPLS
jgi:ATP adenylyltransferase